MRPSVGLPIAFDAEARCLLGSTPWRRIEGRTVCSIELPYGVDLVAVHSGVGIENALRSARWLVSEGVTALLSIGVAGGLEPRLRPGELIIGDRVFEPSSAEERREWFSDGPSVAFAYSTLASEGRRARKGPIVSTLSPVLSAEEKHILYRKSHALAVDMESSAVARVATESELPFFVLRAVNDSPETTVDPDVAGCLGPGGDIHFPVLLRNLCRRPLLAPSLLRMAKDFAIALNTLRRAWRSELNHHLLALLTCNR